MIYFHIVALMFNKKKKSAIIHCRRSEYNFFFLKAGLQPRCSILYIYINIITIIFIVLILVTFFICKSLWIKASAK